MPVCTILGYVTREPTVSFGTAVNRKFSVISVGSGVKAFVCRCRKYHKQFTLVYITYFALSVEWWYLA